MRASCVATGCGNDTSSGPLQGTLLMSEVADQVNGDSDQVNGDSNPDDMAKKS